MALLVSILAVIVALGCLAAIFSSDWKERRAKKAHAIEEIDGNKND